MSASVSAADALSAKEFVGKCFCGAIEFQVNGDPMGQFYCHCDDCQSYMASPFAMVMMFPKEQIKVIKGSDHIEIFNKTGRNDRSRCKVCGTRLFNNPVGASFTATFPALIPEYPWTPTDHFQYQYNRVHVKDGLPKWSGWRNKSDLVPE